MDEMNIEQARAKLGDIVDRAHLANEPTTITRNGRPRAVVVGTEWHAWATGVIEGAAMRGQPDRDPHSQRASDLSAYRPYHAADCPARTSWAGNTCTCGGLSAPLWKPGDEPTLTGATQDRHEPPSSGAPEGTGPETTNAESET